MNDNEPPYRSMPEQEALAEGRFNDAMLTVLIGERMFNSPPAIIPLLSFSK